MTPAKQFVVSIHDVAPPWRSHVEGLLDRLAAVGVSRCSLLVIPNFRGASALDADAAFCEWLRERRRLGDEMVLHGYEHVAVGKPRNARERFENRWFTEDEGEFLSLEYDAAYDRIARGKRMMEGAGLEPRGFVAPAWLVNAMGLQAARDLGFDYTNSYLAVSDLARDRRHWVPSLVFGPGHLNEDLGVALQQCLAPLLARCPAVRVVLHPPCLDHPARLQKVLSLIEGLRRDREPVTYLDLLGWLRRPSGIPARDRHAQ